jgi:hypothetical protein
MDFFSNDTVAQEGADSGRHQKSSKAGIKLRRLQIPLAIQKTLWNQPPCANTKQIPGKLSLCKGMPVMLRSNAATELSMTKGQEAVVYGWEYSTMDSGEKILEMLFVKLLNPANEVHIDGLPPNVVPLTRTFTTTTIHLPDDTSLMVSRNQIEVLPNFGMSDYSSQGKTRWDNVVELGHSESHQAYYTALSRGTTAAGTLILSGFHPFMITGGASGALRQEFRELELLDTITSLQFHGAAKSEMLMADHRGSLIALFRKEKGASWIPETMHPALHWGPKDPFLEWPHTEIVQKKMSGYSNKVKSGPSGKIQNLTVWDTNNDESLPRKKQKKNAEPEGATSKHTLDLSSHVRMVNCRPIGAEWSNNSCAYDAIITILFNTWREQSDVYAVTWTELPNEWMRGLIIGFRNLAIGSSMHNRQGWSLEGVRDHMRRRLVHQGEEFVFGNFTSIPSVLGHLLHDGEAVTSSVRKCRVSGHPVRREGDNVTGLVYIWPAAQQNLQDYLNYMEQHLASACSVCGANQVRQSRFEKHPPLLAFEWPLGRAPLLPDRVTIDANGEQVQFALKGVIYYANNHFTAHVKVSSGTWFHDGMVTSKTLLWEPIQPCHMLTATTAIYCRVEP